MNFSDLTTVNHPFPKTRPEYLNFVEALNKKLTEDTNGQFRRKNGWLSSRIADALAESSGVTDLNVNSLVAFFKQQDEKGSSKKTPNTEQDLKEFIKRLDEQGSILVNGVECTNFHTPNLNTENLLDDEAKFIFHVVDPLSTFLFSGEHLSPNAYYSVTQQNFLLGDLDKGVFTSDKGELKLEFIKEQSNLDKAGVNSAIDPQAPFTDVHGDISIVPKDKFVNTYDDIFTNAFDPQGTFATGIDNGDSIDVIYDFINKLLKQPILNVNGNHCSDFYIPSSDPSDLTDEELDAHSEYFIFKYETPDHKSMEFILGHDEFKEGVLTLNGERYTSSNGKVVIQLVEHAECYTKEQICDCIANDVLHTHCERCDSSIELYDASSDKNAEDVGYCDSCLNEYVYPSRYNIDDEFAITKEGRVVRVSTKLTFSNELHRLVFQDYALPVLTCALNEIAEMLSQDTELTSDLLDDGFQDMVGDLANTAKNDHVAYKVLANYAASPERGDQFNRDYNTYVGNSNASIALMGDDGVRSELMTTGCYMLRGEIQGVASNVLGAIETMYSEEPESALITAIESGDRVEAINELRKLMESMVADFDVF
ncbi:hypothetical protein VCHA53O466_140084 [Vibrio chagasii]|nr:hypothetical protein VCHA53O466_140084 [Vibrio chagasii]